MVRLWNCIFTGVSLSITALWCSLIVAICLSHSAARLYFTVCTVVCYLFTLQKQEVVFSYCVLDCTACCLGVSLWHRTTVGPVHVWADREQEAERLTLNFCTTQLCCAITFDFPNLSCASFYSHFHCHILDIQWCNLHCGWGHTSPSLFVLSGWFSC